MVKQNRMFPLTKPYLRAMGMNSWRELAERDFARPMGSDQKIILTFDWSITFGGKTTQGVSSCYIHRGDLIMKMARERYASRLAMERRKKVSKSK